jgi:hypothetical protein
LAGAGVGAGGDTVFVTTTEFGKLIFTFNAFGVGFGEGAGVAFGVGFGVGAGVAFGVGFGVGAGVAFGVGFGVGAGAGFGAAFGAGAGAGFGAAFGAGAGAGAGFLAAIDLIFINNLRELLSKSFFSEFF